MNKSPAFQFYPKDWLTDEKVLMMDWDARAMHLQCMCYAWVSTGAYSLPDNDDVITKLLGIIINDDWRYRLKPQIFSAWELENGFWVQKRLKAEKNKQLATVEKRRKAANTRWKDRATLPKHGDNARALHLECSSSSTAVVKEKDVSKETSKKKNGKTYQTSPSTSRFKPPNITDVKAFIAEKQYAVDPVAFVNFYESKGWMVGKNKMKSWKSAVVTWHLSETKNHEAHHRTPAGNYNAEYLARIDARAREIIEADPEGALDAGDMEEALASVWGDVH